MHNKLRNSQGFTVVEIILVIVLIAIVSAVAISRFISGNAFNPTIVRDQIISIARTAQQSSLGRADVSLTITPNVAGNLVTIASSDSGGSIESVSVSIDGVTLSGDINETDDCASTLAADSITNAAPMTIDFEELGDLGTSGVTGSTGAITSAVRICLNDDAAASVCVSPSGFAYAGACDV